MLDTFSFTLVVKQPGHEPGIKLHLGLIFECIFFKKKTTNI